VQVSVDVMKLVAFLGISFSFFFQRI